MQFLSNFQLVFFGQKLHYAAILHNNKITNDCIYAVSTHFCHGKNDGNTGVGKEETVLVIT